MHRGVAMSRARLPNKRRNQTTSYTRDGSTYTITVGYFANGEVGEIFINASRANSLLDALMSDAAIIASLAIQYGCPLDAIKHALKRDARGDAASPIGVALDLLAKDRG
jgi:hypothetical protein